MQDHHRFGENVLLATWNGPPDLSFFPPQHTPVVVALYFCHHFHMENWWANDHINGNVDVQLRFPTNSLLHLFSVLFIGRPLRMGLYKFCLCSLKRDLAIRFSSRMNHALTKRNLLFRVWSWSTKDSVIILKICTTRIFWNRNHATYVCNITEATLTSIWADIFLS